MDLCHGGRGQGLISEAGEHIVNALSELLFDALASLV